MSTFIFLLRTLIIFLMQKCIKKRKDTKEKKQGVKMHKTEKKKSKYKEEKCDIRRK